MKKHTAIILSALFIAALLMTYYIRNNMLPSSPDQISGPISVDAPPNAPAVNQLFANAQDKLYIEQIKKELITLSNNKDATSRRIASIKKDGVSWTDGRIGITADGYIFYYDLHESHGMDNVSDIHTLYLPDEKRFLITHDHFCCDINKFVRVNNKAQVIRMFK